MVENAVACPRCGNPVARKVVVTTTGDEALVGMLVPIGRSGLAIVAGYIGIFAVIPFVGIIALIFGILALKDLSEHPEKRGRGRAWFAIIMGVICTLIHAAVLISG